MRWGEKPFFIGKHPVIVPIFLILLSFYQNVFKSHQISQYLTHNIHPFSPYIQPERQFPFHIYIASLYHNETYSFAIRASVLSPFFHKLILVTSPISHSNQKLGPPIFTPFEDLVRCLGSRLVIYKAKTDNSQLSYDIEIFQRNQIYNILIQLHAKPDDIIYVSDCDEIPLAPILEEVISKPPSPILYYGANKYDYSFRWLTEKGWPQPYFVKFSHLHRPQDIESIFHPPNLIYKGIIQSDYIIHISSVMGSVQGILNKLQQFAQAYNFNHPPINDVNHIYARAACGEDYLGRGYKYSLQNPFDESLIPILKDPRMRILNEKIPFNDLEILNLSKVIQYNACDDAIEYLKNYHSNSSSFPVSKY